MDPAQRIADLCRRYGVSSDFGNRLTPLVARACESPPEKRRRLLDVVERSFAEEARRQKGRPSVRDLPPEDRKMISTVASVLHGWNPPTWLRLWEECRRRKGEA